MIDVIYPIMVDAVALPLTSDPEDLSGKRKLGLLDLVDRHLAKEVFPTRERWGESAASQRAVAAMEVELPLPPEALAYLEQQKAARAQQGGE